MSIQTLAQIKEAPTVELVALYNKITGKDTKRFATRTHAESQTWKAIQSLPPEEEKPIAKKTDGKRANYENRKVQLLVEENPKRVGSRAHTKFELLMKYDGRPMCEYKAEEGKHPSLDIEKGWPATEIRWAISLGLVKLV